MVSSSLTIWVDADATPREVKELILRAGQRLQASVVLVANSGQRIPHGFPTARAVVVPGGPDMADKHIAEHAGAGDVSITADIPLAAALVEKRVYVIDPRGHEYTPQNVGERLSVRDFMDELRQSGVETSGPRPYRPQDRQAFAQALDRVLTRAARPRP